MLAQIIDQIRPELNDDGFWQSYLNHALTNPPSVSTHLAILVEPFLQYVLDGKKTIESRFAVRQTPPIGIVTDGDVVLLKRVAGPIVGICRVVNAWHYDLEPESVEELRQKYSVALCASDPEFWAIRSGATYATLMSLDNVLSLAPASVSKSDRRGWVVLRRRTNQLMLWEE
jgi:hypothetical protein